MSSRQPTAKPAPQKPTPQNPAPQKPATVPPKVTQPAANPPQQPKKVPTPQASKPKAEPVQPTRFNPDTYVRTNCSREEAIELKQAFDIFDEDGSGTIDPAELKAAFESMGIQTHSKLIYQVLGELDQDNSGGIDFDEFFKLATSKQPMRETRLDIQRAFNLFDLNREGRITFEELKRVAQDLGEYDNDDQIRKTFKKADLDQDGFVTFEDFYQIMTNSKVYYGTT